MTIEEEKQVLKQQVREIMMLSFTFCMFWFFSNYFYNLGLVTTSVSSSTVLSNTSSIFVYIIALVFLKERLNPIKAIFVIASFGGIVIITL
jgi:solute carrier family 35 protein F5